MTSMNRIEQNIADTADRLSVLKFVKEKCVLGQKYFADAGKLYQEFNTWYDETGETSIAWFEFIGHLKDAVGAEPDMFSEDDYRLCVTGLAIKSETQSKSEPEVDSDHRRLFGNKDWAEVFTAIHGGDADRFRRQFSSPNEALRFLRSFREMEECEAEEDFT